MKHYFFLALATLVTWAKAMQDWEVIAYFDPSAEADGNEQFKSIFLI